MPKAAGGVARAFQVLVLGRVAEPVQALVLPVDDPLEGIAEELVRIVEMDGLHQGGGLEIRVEALDEQDVLEAIRNHPELEVIGTEADGDWRAVAARKR